MKSKNVYASLALGVSMVFGFTGTGYAAILCSTADVTIGDIEATSCGMGTTNNDFTPTDSAWQVNLDVAGGVTNWNLYEKEEGVAGLGNIHDGNTSDINLLADPIGDNSTSGSFSLNVFDPTLITLKDGNDTNYYWYYFSPITAAGWTEGANLSGTWNSESIYVDGSLSHISAYTVVPVPAAVWLFGVGLLGLVGVARHKTASA